MQNECNIIRDILPLYVEGLASTDTVTFVEEHINRCHKCRAELENMKKPGSLEPAEAGSRDNDAMPLKKLKKQWNKRNRIKISAIVLITALVVLLGTYFLGSGFMKRTDAVLGDYSLSEDGTEITLYVGVPTSMGYIRGFRNNGGGVRPHYLTFYSTFGGLNSSFGAKRAFVLELEETDTEIWFERPGGGYELVLQKDGETGEWVRPAK